MSHKQSRRKYFHDLVAGVVDMVIDAHPDYVTARGKRLLRRSLAKRVAGELMARQRAGSLSRLRVAAG